MSATMKGGADLAAFLAALPAKLESNVLRGALKAGADEFAEGARENCRSPEVRATIKTSSRSQPGLVTAKVQTKGPGAYKAPWLEEGTDPHFIAVDAQESGGRTVRRVNRDVKSGALSLSGGKFAETVHHPGAKPHPFMRPAVDTREAAAIEAISAHIAKRATKEGLAAPAEPEEPED